MGFTLPPGLAAGAREDDDLDDDEPEFLAGGVADATASRFDVAAAGAAESEVAFGIPRADAFVQDLVLLLAPFSNETLLDAVLPSPVPAAAIALLIDEVPPLLPLAVPLMLELLTSAARWLSRIRFAPRSLRKSKRALDGLGSSLPSDSRMSAWTSALGSIGGGFSSLAQKAL